MEHADRNDSDANADRSASRAPLRVSALLALAATVASIGMAYSVLLPMLPGAVGALTGGDGRATSWHVGLLSAVFAAAPLGFSPLWGRLSDRIGQKPVLLVGTTGLAGALVLTAWTDQLGTLYLARTLAGAFGAAGTPVTLALIAECTSDRQQRARRFALVGAGTTLGLFAGPLVGAVAYDWASLITVRGTGSGLQAAALLGAALVAVSGILLAATLPGTARGGPPAPEPESSDALRAAAGAELPLAVLAATAAAVIALFEVALALRARANAIPAADLALMFAECSLLMGLAQAILLSGGFGPRSLAQLVAPSFGILAAGLVLTAVVDSPTPRFLAVAAVAVPGGIVPPVVSYFASFVAGAARGAALGRQSAANSLGQTVGSVAGGGIASLGGGGASAVFVVAALVSAVSAGASLGWLTRLESAHPDARQERRFRSSDTDNGGTDT